MALNSVWVTVDGLPATEIAAISPPVWETWADGGCGSLTWNFAMSPKQMHRKLYPGALVEAKVGMHPVFSGRLSEPDRTTWQCVAYGHAAHARKLTALSAGVATRDVAAAKTTAQGWGLAAIDPAGIVVGTVAGDDTGPITFGELLDQWATDQGKRWGVDASRRFYLRADSGAPRYMVSPDVAALGQTDEGMASHLVARFENVGGTFSTTMRPATGVVVSQELIDLTSRGPLTLAEANYALDGILALGKTRPAFTGGLTLHRTQIQSRGASPFLPTMTAGEVATLTGVPTAWVRQSTTLDFVIGKTKFDAATPDVIYVEPVDAAPRNFADIIAA